MFFFFLITFSFNMASTDNNIGEPVVTVQPSSHNNSVEPRRRVSIASDPVIDGRLGHDNLGFEQNRGRKISQQSEHSGRKSILHNNSGQDNESLHSHHSFYGID